MNQPIEEQLSAFMDGELGRDETRFVLKRAAGDHGLVARWTRYHVARQALRRQEIVALRVDFSSALMARLDAEDAPMRDRNTWLRWGSGGAIAAAVAVAALMVTKPATEPESTPIAASAPVARVNPNVAAAATQVASTSPAFQTPLVPNSPIQTTAASFGSDLTEPVAVDPRLQSYLIRHYEATGTTGQADFVPYILLAQPAQPLEARPVENR
ncbi:MAG TPA: RseA family anti-sigma factor [Rhodanobacteraceae bacterium]|jgi:sigma-E factor negative regulatory protein RseA|nr:RseA family anti-sigma factor [Rhodanobacteraceae bacterium]